MMIPTVLAGAILAGGLGPLPVGRQPRLTPVVDVQKLRVVDAAPLPNTVLTCDVLVFGGGLGGVAAAEALAGRRHTVIVAEPTSWLGGQLSSQGVACPDENAYIEREPGCGTRRYRELRAGLRDHYAAQPGLVAGRAANPGQCWVSRMSGEPAAWEQVTRARLERLKGPSGIREIFTRTQLARVKRFPSGSYHYADLVNLDTGRVIRVAARYLLDASEWGDGLHLAGSPTVVGAEARSEHQEPSAPERARPDWIQSLTYCFAVRWQPEGSRTLVEKPAEYETFKAMGEYTLGYDYSDGRGRVFYKVFSRVPNSGGPFWTYRRLIAASSFKGNPRYSQDLALINWRGNDFHDENPLNRTPEDQIRVLARAKAFSQGFLYWLQRECPRDDGGTGYPEMQLDLQAMGTTDGYAMFPYIRESRRLKSIFTLTENHLIPRPGTSDQKWGDEFDDTVGVALYAIDIHPARGEPPLLSRALPYHLPLGAFIPREGPLNVIPAAKNFGATRLALASARMHPTEWLSGEVAGHLAGFCLRTGLSPSEVRSQTSSLREFQSLLAAEGIPLRWSEIIK